MTLRDELFKKFGTDFHSSIENRGLLTPPNEFEFPLDEEGVTLFHDFFFTLKDDFRFHMLVDISLERDRERHVLHYQLLNLEVHFRLQVSVDISESCFFPSLSHLWSSALVFENEICERGPLMTSSGGRTEQRKKREKMEEHLHESKSEIDIRSLPRYELPTQPTAAQKNRKWNRVGPFTSPFNGGVRVDYLTDGHRVYDAVVEKGFSFRDFEKKSLKNNIFHQVFWFERLCQRDSIYGPLLWVESIEELYAIDVPAKAMAMRMVWMELARVESHLHYLWKLTTELGFFVESSTLNELKEQVTHLFTLHSGKSQNYSLFTFGGMRSSNPLGWGTECLEAAKYILKVLQYVERALNRNSRWMAVTHGFPMTAGMALDFAYSGPNLRACGVNYDARKIKAPYFYRDVDFDVPLGIDGTNYDRYLVRMEELKQSLRIINQVLDHLPAGESLNTEHPLYEASLHQNKEGHSFSPKLISKLFPNFEGYRSLESAEGELGLFLKTDEEGNLKNLHIRSSSLVHIGAYPELIKGGATDGAFTAYTSLNIDPWEMDR